MSKFKNFFLPASSTDKNSPSPPPSTDSNTASSRARKNSTVKQQPPPVVDDDNNNNEIENKPPSRKNSITSANNNDGKPPSRKNSVTSSDGKPPSRKNSTSSVVPPAQQRFHVYEDSSHTHHLRTAKRQEKITGMIRDLLGANKNKQQHIKEEETSAATTAVPSPEPNNNNTSQHQQPPSLLSGLLNQIKNGDEFAADSILKQAECNQHTFNHKYGKCQEVIGKGSYGIVRIAHKPDPNNSQHEQLYAVKELKKRSRETDSEYNRRLTSEFCISSSLHHPNIIHTLDLLHGSNGEYCEVMEFCSGGDLYSLVLAAGKLEFLEADCFFKQILLGVNYMHQMGVAHRDLKPENILLTANGAVKITDFGNGECFRMAWENEIHMSKGLCGSTPYISPEEYGDEVFDPRPVDIWAIGVIYMAMRTGRHLWTIAKASEDEFYDRYLKGRKSEKGYEPIETLKRARCRNVVYSILDPVPTRRITCKQILKSEWGREIQICEAGRNGG